jgi:hypothetical protein
MLFTVKPAAATKSIGQSMLTLKSVGGVGKISPQYDTKLTLHACGGVGVAVAVDVAVGVGVGVSATYVNVQVNSFTGLMQQVIASLRMCIVLSPGTTGEVLKWKVTVLFDTVNEFAPMLFTLKPLG